MSINLWLVSVTDFELLTHNFKVFRLIDNGLYQVVATFRCSIDISEQVCFHSVLIQSKPVN